MFVGHYGVSFAAKRINVAVPLWVLFLAVQWLDVIWAPLVLLGVEKVRIVPGFTATNPLDLYYMPYTHSLVAAILWAAAATVAYNFFRRDWRSALFVGAAVFSHWIFDFVVHRPDLPLYDNTAKVGLGLWNYAALAFALEALLLLGSMVFYLERRPVRLTSMFVFGLVMLAVQGSVFFGPPPPSPAAVAVMALGAYAAFALAAWYLVDRHGRIRVPN